MNKNFYLRPIIAFLCMIYILLLYLVFAYYRVVDFTPFYISTKALIYGVNPYPISESIPANLNPPFFLCIFYPLGLLNYQTAMIIASLLSVTLGLIGARIAFFYAFSEQFRQKYKLILYLLYFSFFPVLMDTSIVQVGALLFFFIMVGYHFYLQKNDSMAGLFWGFIIALKLFPALLLFYVIKQRRYRVFLIMIATVLICMLLPLGLFGAIIYKQYTSMLALIYWYGDSWNASIYGYLFRLMMDLKHPGQNLAPVQGLYLLLFSILLIVYFFTMGPKEINVKTCQLNHQPFCLTLAMMILLSPFGWLYYFSLLIFPLLLTGLTVFQGKAKTLIPKIIWVVCFCLINYPLAYVVGKQMSGFIEKISFFSFYFYGLILLNSLLIHRQKLAGEHSLPIAEIQHDEYTPRFLMALLISIAFGLIVPLNSFLIRISMGNPGTFTNAELDSLLKEGKFELRHD
ncbi:MAG: DUF2029 domain-containing protein [Tatlockia sp.]|nr:DUF2029 domain-containing protein [Tatlockia sp.]